MKILWSPAAIADLEAVRAYIAEDNSTAANRVAQAIRQTVERLAVFPASGRAGRVPDTRELVVPGLPYIVVYTVRENEVRIASVLHGMMRWPDAF
jgi:toxin ParE1/3/4